MARAPRLLMLPIGDERTASTRYRVLAHRDGLRAAGFDPRVRWPAGRGRAGRLVDLLRDAALPSAADLVFVHRKTFPPPFGAWLGSHRPPVVFDLDDAIDLPPPGRADDARTLARYRRNFESIAHAAALVVCGSAALAARVPHERTVVVPTAIDATRFAPGAVTAGSGPVLGWVGQSSNFGYLERLAAPVAELARRHPGLSLVVAADREPSLPGVPVTFRRWSLEDEVRCFDGITVGLMPLDDTPWARAKCAFKAIQYLALGIPAVASPVGANTALIEDGVTGFLPRDERGWIDAIDALLHDAALRARVARAGRIVIEREYALDVVTPRLAALLHRVLECAPQRVRA